MNSKKDIIIFGIQGSGKGTQAQIIAKRWNLKIFETGSELRRIREEKSVLGNTIREIIDRGDLVPNQIVMDIVEIFLNTISENDLVLFDGLPRSMPQKESLDALLKQKGRKLIGLFLDVPRNEVVRRMKQRKREDDSADVIERRIKNYEDETLPVIEKYEAEGNMIRINGFQDIDKVTEEITQKLGE